MFDPLSVVVISTLIICTAIVFIISQSLYFNFVPKRFSVVRKIMFVTMAPFFIVILICVGMIAMAHFGVDFYAPSPK